MSKKCSKTEKPLREHRGRSLTGQITVIFISVMAVTILLCWLVNNFFLEKFYILNKENTLYDVYDSICNECENGDIDSEEFDLKLQKYSGTHNVSIVIINSLYEPMIIYSNEPEDRLILEIRDNIRGQITAERVFKQSDDYVMILRYDSRMQSDYIEMWGILPNDAFFMMRTAVESLKVSAGIANRFLLYIGLGAVAVSTILIFVLSHRITKPILEIADISEKMSEMDFEAKYSGKSNNEIGVLGQSINKMSDNLREAIENLKKANDELQKDNELKTRVDAMRKEFISNVSHELKTPIAIIQGYAEGLKEGVNEADQRDYYCDVIADEASKMNSMVKKLLTLNQLESGADVLQKEVFDMASLVVNYVQSAEILTKQKNICVKVVCDKGCFVYADEFKIEEAFMNFFSNAINHAAFDGEKRIDVSVKKVENRIRVSVENTGEPIPDESICHLWEKFYKVDKARSREYGGSGVGLSIVKAVIEAHEGTYGAENTESGVRFWFEINHVSENIERR